MFLSRFCLCFMTSDPTCYDAVSLYNAMVGTDTKVDESEDSYESENKCSAEFDYNSVSLKLKERYRDIRNQSKDHRCLKMFLFHVVLISLISIFILFSFHILFAKYKKAYFILSTICLLAF